MELIILGVFALIGVVLLRFLTGIGTQQQLPPPPSPYTSQPAMPYGFYAPPAMSQQPKVIKRKIIIMPEKIVRTRTTRKRRLK